LEKLSGSAAEAGRGGGSVASRLEKFNREARTTAARTYADLLAKEGTGGDLSAYLAKYGAGVNTMPPAGPTEGALGGVSQTLGNIPTWLMLSKLFEKI
jgi:hypothetical protein